MLVKSGRSQGMLLISSKMLQEDVSVTVDSHASEQSHGTGICTQQHKTHGTEIAIYSNIKHTEQR